MELLGQSLRRSLRLSFLCSGKEFIVGEVHSYEAWELSIKEYVNQFNALAKYGLELLNTQKKKAMKFAKGSNSSQKDLH